MLETTHLVAHRDMETPITFRPGDTIEFEIALTPQNDEKRTFLRCSVDFTKERTVTSIGVYTFTNQFGMNGGYALVLGDKKP